MAYDADDIRNFIANNLKANAVMPSHPARAIAIPMAKEIYKERHLIEFFFHNIKRLRSISLTCEKPIASFKAFIAIACAMLWLS